MKKAALLVFAVLCLLFSFPAAACAADDEDWESKPVITSLYEVGKGRVFIEWEGKSKLYRVFVDEKNVADVVMDNATVDLKPGSHKITILPLKVRPKEDANTQIQLKVAGLVDGRVDLSALGIEARDILTGNYSDTVKLDYNPSGITDSSPVILGAATDPDYRVCLEIQDNFDADVYRVFIKSGTDRTSVDFDTADPDAAFFIQKGPSSVTLILDPGFLERQSCMRPKLDTRYDFSLMLRQRPTDYMTDAPAEDSLLDSKESKAYAYTPREKWKIAPEIQVSTQAGEGSVYLKWDHDADGKDVRYKVLEYDMLVLVKKGEKELGITEQKEYEIQDLVNGRYTFAVQPVIGDKEGEPAVVTVDVTADWVEAPELNCSAEESPDVRLSWNSADKVDTYHITVYAGSGSLLRFVNLDYEKIAEFDVPAEDGETEFIYTYPDRIDPENGVKLKFEVYGIHHVPGGADQHSSTSQQTVTLKKRTSLGFSS